MNVSISRSSLQGIRKRLADLPQELIKASESAVLRAGAKPIQTAAKAKAPVGTGLLKKSIGMRVKKTKGIYTARVGPRKGFKGKPLGKKKNKAGIETERFADPNKYSHLVEFGTSHSPAKPFIRPAIESAKGEVVAAMAAGLDKHLTRTVARLRRKAALAS